MSTAEKKAALFGAPAPKKKASETHASSQAQATNAKSSSSGNSRVGKTIKMGLSEEQKEVKRKEAAVLVAAGEDYLSTSMFKWSADHLGAAPKFEAAANTYKAIGDSRRGWEFMQKASQSHAAYDSFGAAGNALISAARMAATAEPPANEIAADFHIKAAEMWGMYGDHVQVANSYTSAAELLEEIDEERALELYLNARSVLVPAEANSSAALKQMNVRGLEMLRKMFRFLLRGRDSKLLVEALTHARLLLLVFRAFEQDASLYKTQAAIVILMIHSKDIVAAEQAFLDSLGDKGYAHSKECEFAESLLEAAKRLDGPAIAALQTSDLMQYLDRDVQHLMKKVGVSDGSASAKISITSETSAASGSSSTIKVQQTEEMSMQLEVATGKVSGEATTTVVVEEVEREASLEPQPESSAHIQEEDCDGNSSDDDLL